jgi:hypothetical protein
MKQRARGTKRSSPPLTMTACQCGQFVVLHFLLMPCAQERFAAFALICIAVPEDACSVPRWCEQSWI